MAHWLEPILSTVLGDLELRAARTPANEVSGSLANQIGSNSKRWTDALGAVETPIDAADIFRNAVGFGAQEA
jgi:hypothetical protein